ncbi:MAG TPA: LysR family transcriptional regulator [Blastocatellia bacterium]|nr:LysR family transcriptional regulator [Blastocatellia bacterium]HMV83926.1 LysR family transcriptional regulator [Blastocatellia bacterium]HMX27562.1 LysR family transcriptional regulator [Blastocatellia bacterium]HMY72258.1 LysR family transcriptional regulator [Blastocatellia bacterium]HMZ17364.1 LysR family transcriptional regulator [Blastocatellia bacterium]
MDLSQLEIFLSIAEEKSFSRAAEKMLRTQPAISIAIKRLEEELGEPLFDRSSKNGALTEAGKILLSYAQRMLNLRDEAKEAVGELRGMFRGRLTIGANESTSLYLLPPLLLEYRKRHPNIKIEVFRNVSEKIPLEVQERNLDFGFLSYDPMNPQLQSIEIHRDELTLVVPPKHRLAKLKQIAVKDLAEEQFVAHNVKTPSRTKIFELFAQNRTPLNICIELATLETIKEFVLLNAGIAILPRLAVESEINTGTLVEVLVKGMKIEKTLRLVYRREASLSHAAKSFLEIVKEQRGL